MDGGAWWATVHGVAKSRTQLSDFIQISLAQDTLHLSMRRDVWGESSVSVDCYTCGYPDLAKPYCVMTSQRVLESNLFHSEISYSDQSCCYKEVIKELECFPRPVGNCNYLAYGR